MEGVAIKKGKVLRWKETKKGFSGNGRNSDIKKRESEKKIILKAAIVKVSSEFDEKWTRTSKLSKLWLKNSKKTFRAE